jgi:stage III sporulation protein AA
MTKDNPDTGIFYDLLDNYMPARIKAALLRLEPGRVKELEEIRLRGALPLMGVFAGYDRFIGADGQLFNGHEKALRVTEKELNELFYRLCDQSLYAYQEDIIRGFITLKGGHRAGVCGTVVYQGDRITGMRDISSVSIRLSRQLKGCAEAVFPSIIRNHRDVYNTLILSPPRCGKTTLLRDLCRLISQGTDFFSGLRTAVIDERSELAAMYRGIPQNDLGPRTDILDGCRKSEGIEMVLRGMAPHVIVVDELGGTRDAESVKLAWNAGVRLMATAHAFDLTDFRGRFGVGNLAHQEGFERIIVLGINNGKRWIRVMNTHGDELDFLVQGSGMPADFHRMYGLGTQNVGQAGREAACTLKTHGDPCQP